MPTATQRGPQLGGAEQLRGNQAGDCDVAEAARRRPVVRVGDQRRIAAEEGCEVEWAPQFAQAPVAFDGELVDIAAGVLQELTGDAPRLPSGPLHDAAEMARVVPAVMLFVRSIGGVSHTKDEDTAVPDLELSVRALHGLALRTLTWAEARP